MSPTSEADPVRRHAFTLIELLIVIGIIAILIGMVMKFGGAAIDDAQSRETRAVLLNLDMAVQQFHQDAPLGRVPEYKKRYKNYPCDELIPFFEGAIIPPWPDIRPPGGDLNVPTEFMNIRYGDIKAMALVINLYGGQAKAILDRVSGRYRRPPDVVGEFYDRNDNGMLDTDDEPLVYFIDAWENPIEYFATVWLDASTPDPRRDASTTMVRANRNKPFFVSYGPNGAEQLELQRARDPLTTPLVADYEIEPHKIDQPLNGDNVYSDDALKDRFAHNLEELHDD